MNEQIALVIEQAIKGGYDLIDGIFNFDNNIDFGFKEVFVPMVVKAVTDLSDDGQIDNATVSTILNTAYDAVDKQFNFDGSLDFAFKMILVNIATPLIVGGVNNLLKNVSGR